MCFAFGQTCFTLTNCSRPSAPWNVAPNARVVRIACTCIYEVSLAFSRPANHSEDLVLRNVGDESTDQNNNITMTSEDLLQPGHVVKERWKVVSLS